MYHWPRIFDKKTCFVFGSLSFALYVFVLDLFIYLFSSIISFGRYIYGSLIVQSSNLLPIHLILLAGHRFSVKIYVWSNTHNDSEYWLFFLSATKNSFCFFFWTPIASNCKPQQRKLHKYVRFCDLPQW